MSDPIRSLAALRAAVDGVSGIQLPPMPHNASECPVLPQDMQNEPTAPATGAEGSASPANPCPKKPQNAPECPGKTSKAQNEPTARSAELSPRQLSAIALLFAGRSFSAVGRTLKIDRKTLYRWRRMPAFAAEVRARSTGTRAQRESPVRQSMPPMSWKQFEGLLGAKGVGTGGPR